MNIIGWSLAAGAFVNVSTGFRIPSFTARIRSLALTSNEKLAKKDSAIGATLEALFLFRSPPLLPTILFAQNNLAICRGGKRRQ
jgi:hypothetical protein